MNETIWISVPDEFSDALDPLNDHFASLCPGPGTGDVTIYRFDVDSSDYDEFLAEVARRGIPSAVERRRYSFSKDELLQAEILRIDVQDIGVSESARDRSVCPRCRRAMSSSHTSRLSALPESLRERDIVSAGTPNQELIVSDRLRALLEQYSSAYCFAPVFDLRQKDKAIPGYSQLRVPVGVGRIVSPSVPESAETCPECGLHSVSVCMTPLCFKRDAWSGLPLCYTQDYFGSVPKRFQWRWLIASGEFYRSLLDHRMTGFWAAVSYLV